jgi:hypothetical protein
VKKYEGAVNKAAGTQPPKFLSWRAISALFYLCEYSCWPGSSSRCPTAM